MATAINTSQAGGLRAGTLPPDLLDVTDEAYATFIEQPPEGKVWGSKKGMPAWGNIPPPSEEKVQEHALIKKQHLTDECDAIILLLARAVRLNMITDEVKHGCDIACY